MLALVYFSTETERVTNHTFSARRYIQVSNTTSQPETTKYNIHKARPAWTILTQHFTRHFIEALIDNAIIQSPRPPHVQLVVLSTTCIHISHSFYSLSLSGFTKTM